jgi:hypothetical protein
LVVVLYIKVFEGVAVPLTGAIVSELSFADPTATPVALRTMEAAVADVAYAPMATLLAVKALHPA